MNQQSLDRFDFLTPEECLVALLENMTPYIKSLDHEYACIKEILSTDNPALMEFGKLRFSAITATKQLAEITERMFLSGDQNLETELQTAFWSFLSTQLNARLAVMKEFTNEAANALREDVNDSFRTQLAELVNLLNLVQKCHALGWTLNFEDQYVSCAKNLEIDEALAAKTSRA